MNGARTIQLQVNGKPVTLSMEARTPLADLLRDGLNLTGTHLGCEHGICGACTVLVDGEPARSCITLAAACEGAAVTTIEGLDDDEITAELRAAFSREHALQCGYCTPGMLASARDVVLRMATATGEDIRLAMSGNLCRCTGYVGIVRAVSSVIEDRAARGAAMTPSKRTRLGPVGSAHAEESAGGTTPAVSRPAAPRPAAPTAAAAPLRPQATLRQSFHVGHPPDVVWRFFGRPGDVAPCLPGTSVVGTPGTQRVEVHMRVKLGPIVAEFEGGADVERDDPAQSGLLRGSAVDARSGSIARGDISYRLAGEGPTSTRVDVSIAYALSGPLAQFGRGAIVQDIARRMTEAFAANVQARLDHRDAPAAAELDAGSLLLGAVRDRLRSLWRALFRR